MRKIRITLLSVLVIILIVGVYILFISDNLFVHVANHSLSRKNVMMRVWINGELITNDSLEADLTGMKEDLKRLRAKRSNDYVIKAQVNDYPAAEKSIRLNWFAFIYITVDNSETSGIDEAVINSYTLREAWDMNLITGSKE
jgi:hypothetical protein